MAEIPDEVLAKLMRFAESQGVDLGVAPHGSDADDLAPTIPPVDLNRCMSEVAHETGLNLKGSGLYRYGGNLVTVDDETGEAVEMEVDAFRTWIDQWQLNYYKKRERKRGGVEVEEPVRATIRKDQASVLLKSDAFLQHLPELERILPVRLPVLDEDGVSVRLLPYGYDEHRRTYTARTGVEVDEDWDCDSGREYLESLLVEFPFGDPERSRAVQVAAMLSTFCHLMLPELGRLPMIYYNANIPGSGKSRLAELCIYAIFGTADTVNYGDGRGDEFRKELDSWALKGMPYCMIDDVGGLIKSNLLNKWLTFPTWSGRVMHSKRLFSTLNRAITLLTGNQATLSPDLSRRSLIVDLWSPELAADRAAKLSRVIDQEWLAAPENRRNMLSAMWALVRNWSDQGALRYEKVMPSFEGWSRIVPAIVKAAGFECPLQAPELTDAGGKQEVEFRRMVAAAAERHRLGKPFIGPDGKEQEKRRESAALRLREWCEICRELGLFHSTVSDRETMREFLDEKPGLYKLPIENGVQVALTEADRDNQAAQYMDRPMQTKFGGMLHKHYRGRVVRLENGMRVQFADREARHSTFEIKVLELPEESDGSEKN